jgi:hypothetical protein
MGIAVGDCQRDGLVDFMFSNTGSANALDLLCGETSKTRLNSMKNGSFFRNDGNFTGCGGRNKLADYANLRGRRFTE